MVEGREEVLTGKDECLSCIQEEGIANHLALQLKGRAILTYVWYR